MKMFPCNSGSVVGSRSDGVIKAIETANFAKVVSGELERRQGTLAGEVLRMHSEGQTDPEIAAALGIDTAAVTECRNDFDASVAWALPGKGKKYRRKNLS